MAVQMTEDAIREAKSLLESKPEGVFIRLKVSGGGCAGITPELEFDNRVDTAHDKVFEFGGVKLVVDKKSLLYADGTTIDFQQSGLNKNFTMTNPNTKHTCGCGRSHSL